MRGTNSPRNLNKLNHMKHLNTSITLILASLTLGGSLVQAVPETADLKSPQALKIVEPTVPANYARWGLPGHVVVEFQINEDGCTEKIRLVETTDRKYAENVRQAVRQWRFETPEIAGVTYRQAVNFSHPR